MCKWFCETMWSLRKEPGLTLQKKFRIVCDQVSFICFGLIEWERFNGLFGICLLQKPIYIVSIKQDGIYQELDMNMYRKSIAQTFLSWIIPSKDQFNKCRLTMSKGLGMILKILVGHLNRRLSPKQVKVPSSNFVQNWKHS